MFVSKLTFAFHLSYIKIIQIWFPVFHWACPWGKEKSINFSRISQSNCPKKSNTQHKTALLHYTSKIFHFQSLAETEFFVKNLNQVLVRIRIHENVHCHWAHLSSEALVKCHALSYFYFGEVISTWWMREAAETEREIAYRQKGRPPAYFLVFSTGEEEQYLSLMLFLWLCTMIRFTGLPGHFPGFFDLLKHYHLHCQSSSHGCSAALQNLYAGKCS